MAETMSLPCRGLSSAPDSSGHAEFREEALLLPPSGIDFKTTTTTMTMHDRIPS